MVKCNNCALSPSRRNKTSGNGPEKPKGKSFSCFVEQQVLYIELTGVKLEENIGRFYTAISIMMHSCCRLKEFSQGAARCCLHFSQTALEHVEHGIGWVQYGAAALRKVV